MSPRRRRIGLYYRLYFDNIGQDEVCEFLGQLLRHLRGHVIVVLDNARIHRGRKLQAFLKRRHRLHLEYFPAYAPELNPDQGVWSLAKRKLANGQADDIKALHRAVRSTLTKLRRRPAQLRACIKHSGLSLFLP